MSKTLKLTGLVVATLILSVVTTQTVSADTTSASSNVVQQQSDDDSDLPEMSLDQALASGQSEVIIDDLGNSQLGNELRILQSAPDVGGTTDVIMRRASGGRWVYKYTVEPFAFYYNSTTKKWKMVQVTSTLNHVVNTMIGGYVGSPSYGGFHH